MFKLINRYHWLGIIIGVLLIIAGGLIITFSIINIENVNLALSIVVASVSFIIGAIYITAGILSPLTKMFDVTFLVGAFAIAIGVILLMNVDIVPTIITYTIAVSLIALGAIYLIRGIISIVNKCKVPTIVVCFVVAVIALTLGILAIVFNTKLLIAIYIAAGVILVGVGGFIIYLLVRKKKAVPVTETEEE